MAAAGENELAKILLDMRAQLEAERKRFDELTAAFNLKIAQATPLPEDDTGRGSSLGQNSDFSDLAAQVPEFPTNQDDSEECAIWIDRVRGIFDSGKGRRLADTDKTAIIRSKLGNAQYQQLSAAVNPVKLSELTLEKTLEMLKDHFGQRESVFMRRMKVWRIRRDEDESFDSLFARVNTEQGRRRIRFTGVHEGGFQGAGVRQRNASTYG